MQLIVCLGFSFAKIWKNCCFAGGLWPNWGNTTGAAMAGLGSIGIIVLVIFHQGLQYNESYSLSCSGAYMRVEIGNVMAIIFLNI